MSPSTKYSANALGWQRNPADPLRVWRVVEGKLKAADGKTQQFSIQEIPEDRYEDVLDLMCDVFLQDEPICVCHSLFNNPEAVTDLRNLWNFAIQHGIAVGAFLVDEKNPKPILAGVNVIYMSCAASKEGWLREINLKSEIAQIICEWFSDLEKEANINELYNVDKYIAGFGLCVNRSYRSQGLGYHLLKARDEMSVAYDIQGTMTTFSGASSQKSAANAGFETLITGNYSDVRNENGHEVFPGISEKLFKVMGKQYPKSQ